MLRALLVAGVTLHSGACLAQTFPFDAMGYKSKLSQQLKIDGDDPVKACVHQGDTYVCTFEQAGFSKSLASLKALNLINGTFNDKSAVILTVQGGHVAKIAVKGDRSDPANMLRTIGHVGSALISLGVPQDKAQAELKTLGLMRGDDDPTIGQPQTDILAEAAITCNNLPTSKTSTFGCVIEPRY